MSQRLPSAPQIRRRIIVRPLERPSDPRNILLADLAERNQRYEDGEIDEDEYQAVREALQRRLLELWLEQAEA